jgi:hypothetical protein
MLNICIIILLNIHFYGSIYGSIADTTWCMILSTPFISSRSSYITYFGKTYNTHPSAQ